MSVEPTNARASDQASAVTVCALVGHRDVQMAITCLGSLLDASAETLRFRVHDDGTLTEADRASLVDRLVRCSFVDRTAADQQIGERLARYPWCSAFRARQIYGLKLFDVPLLSSEAAIAFCDSDVLFLRPFTNLFSLEEHEGCVFMQDCQDAYALRPWHLTRRTGILVPRKLNCGLFYLRLWAYELDFLEWLIGRNYPVYWRLPWLEQTCWAALAWRSSARLWDSRQISVIRAIDEVSDQMVAGHFTSSVRGMLHGALRLVRRDEPTMPVRTVAMRQLTPARLAVSHVTRFLRTRVVGR